MIILCECLGNECRRSVLIDSAVYQKILDARNQRVIATSCNQGAKPNDTLVDDRGNYKLYREGEKIEK